MSSWSEALDAIRTTVRDTNLRRLQVGWLATHMGRSAFLVVNLVIAYDIGGATAVGVMGLVRYLTPTILAPLSGLPTARWRPDRILIATDAIRTLAVALATMALAIDAPIAWLYLAVALEAGAGAFTRPLHMALLPCIARTPEQLVAANVASSAVEGLGTFLGPAIVGVLLATSGPLGADLAVVAIYAIGVAAVAGLDVQVVGRRDGSLAAVRTQLAAGVRTVASVAGTRLVMFGIVMQPFVRGLLIVLTVIAALELLGMGEPGVGALNAALGAGALVGAFAAVTLAGRSRMGPAFLVAMAAWGAPIAVIGLVPTPAVALSAMAAIGAANSVIDVAGFTLALRTAPNRSRVAVLGLLDTAANGSVAVGGLVAPLLIAAVGIQGALLVTGAILPIAAVVAWPFMRRIDEGSSVSDELTRLVRADRLFAPLPLATVEYVATVMDPVDFAPGDWLMREGEIADRYVLIVDGTAEVTMGETVMAPVGPGDGVGEIGLLRDVPRTASVRAVGPVHGYSLVRSDFLEAVTGDRETLAIADDLVARRLGGPGPTGTLTPRQRP